MNTVENNASPPDDAWGILKGFLSPARQKKLESAAAQRTFWIQLVLQDVHDPHNVAACMRSAEAMGVNNVHIISRNKTRVSSVAKGVQHWLDVQFHPSIAACANELKSNGYALAGAYPDQNSIPLYNLPLDRPLAVVFGNEHEGLSEHWKEHVDYHFHIPMVGLVESLNISVSAAITMHQLKYICLDKKVSGYHLSEFEQEKLLSKWVCRQFRSWKLMIERSGALRNNSSS